MFKKILPLNIIISLRMFGLFIVLPVLSVYALDMPNSSHTMVWIIIGGYAITQMLFQVPFGVVSLVPKFPLFPNYIWEYQII